MPDAAPIVITPAHLRAARGLLDWTQADLAERAGCSLSTIRDIEKERRIAKGKILRAISFAFFSAGVVLGYGDGINPKTGEFDFQHTGPQVRFKEAGHDLAAEG